MITAESVELMDLAVGVEVYALIKAPSIVTLETLGKLELREGTPAQAIFTGSTVIPARSRQAVQKLAEISENLFLVSRHGTSGRLELCMHPGVGFEPNVIWPVGRHREKSLWVRRR